MGSTNRGQLRPHFAGGRSPPFIVAALSIGLAIMGISYYTLSRQYTVLEHEMSTLLQNKHLVEDERDVVRAQLNIKEQEYDRLKAALEQTMADIVSLRKAKADVESKNQGLESSVKSLNEELLSEKKTIQNLQESHAKEVANLEGEKTQLNQEIEKLKGKLKEQQQPPPPATSNQDGNKDGIVNRDNIVVSSNDNKGAIDKNVEGDIVPPPDDAVAPLPPQTGNQNAGDVEGKADPNKVVAAGDDSANLARKDIKDNADNNNNEIIDDKEKKLSNPESNKTSL